MKTCWIAALLVSTVLAVVPAFAVPPYGGPPGSLDNEEELEVVVHRGVTICGVTRRSIKHRSIRWG